MVSARSYTVLSRVRKLWQPFSWSKPPCFTKATNTRFGMTSQVHSTLLGANGMKTCQLTSFPKIEVWDALRQREWRTLFPRSFSLLGGDRYDRIAPQYRTLRSVKLFW